MAHFMGSAGWCVEATRKGNDAGESVGWIWMRAARPWLRKLKSRLNSGSRGREMRERQRAGGARRECARFSRVHN